MFISIDDVKDDKIEGWAYTNAAGEEERVELTDTTGIDDKALVNIVDTCYQEFSVFVEDIPKLIKALQAAHAYHVVKGTIKCK